MRSSFVSFLFACLLSKSAVACGLIQSDKLEVGLYYSETGLASDIQSKLNFDFPDYLGVKDLNSVIGNSGSSKTHILLEHPVPLTYSPSGRFFVVHSKGTGRTDATGWLGWEEASAVENAFFVKTLTYDNSGRKAKFVSLSRKDLSGLLQCDENLKNKAGIGGDHVFLDLNKYREFHRSQSGNRASKILLDNFHFYLDSNDQGRICKLTKASGESSGEKIAEFFNGLKNKSVEEGLQIADALKVSEALGEGAVKVVSQFGISPAYAMLKQEVLSESTSVDKRLQPDGSAVGVQGSLHEAVPGGENCFSFIAPLPTVMLPTKRKLFSWKKTLAAVNERQLSAALEMVSDTSWVPIYTEIEIKVVKDTPNHKPAIFRIDWQ